MTGHMVRIDAAATITGLASLEAATILLGRGYEDYGGMLTLPSTPPEELTLQLNGRIDSMGLVAGTQLTVVLQWIADSVGPAPVLLASVAGPA
jgi:hypothetical protein